MRAELFKRLFPHHANKSFVKGPMIAADHLAFLLNKPIGEVCRSGELLAEGLLKAQQLYQSDFIIVFFDVLVEPEALGIELKYRKDHNPYTLSHINPGQLKNISTLKRGRIPQLFSAAKICRKKLGADFPIFISMKDPFSLAAMTTGTEDFLSSLILDEAQSIEVLETCVKIQLNLLTEIISQGFIPFIGSPIGSGSLISKKKFEQFVAPYLQPLFCRAVELSSFRCLHICGSTEHFSIALKKLNPDLLSIEIFYPQMWQKLTSTIAMGYVSTDLFYNKKAEDIRLNTLDCINSLPRPFILSSGCDLPALAKPDLVQEMMQCQS